MRLEARLKLGFYPLPVEHGPSIRARLNFPPAETPATVLDPCVGEGVALKSITSGSGSKLYGIELDSLRAETANRAGVPTVQGNLTDVHCTARCLSLLYLNPPYDFEISELQRNQRMERVFLGHTYSWLKLKGVLVMVIPGKAIESTLDTLTTRFRDIRIYRMLGELSEKYDQYAIFGVRHNNSGRDADEIKTHIRSLLYNPTKLPILTDAADFVYSVPPGGEVELTYSGLPFDEIEDRLLSSGAWDYVAPLILPKKEVTGGRPITPLHGPHVGLLATAGMINGVFGDGEEKHIARWQPVKYTEVTEEIEEDGTEIVRTRERFSNELALVFVTGDTMVLTESEKREEKSQEEQQTLDYDDADDSSKEVAKAPVLVKPPAQEGIPRSAEKARGGLFESGRLVMSSGVHELVLRGFLDVGFYLDRHLRGDWGDIHAQDLEENSKAVHNGCLERIVSSYDTPESPEGRILIITEADRSVTSILFPSEY